MCGIAGLIQLEGVSNADLEPLLRALAHRGPDGQGSYINRTGQVGLVHTRLAIVDLEGGKQPFVSRDGREGLVANGEIYNHQEIRRHLDDYHFDTQSDCEVILPLTKRFGREAYPKLRGMFAYGVWLGVHRTLTLGRDPFGIKPLHYWCDGKRFAFASEIKALLALPFIQATLNRDALWDFFNLRYCPGEETLFDGIKRLPPASVMQVKLEDDHLVTQITSFQGDLPTLSAEGDGTSEDDVATAIEESLSAHMMADVPVGAYLSGGLDSSTLTTLAARQNSHLHTFTLGFGEESDENEDAARLAQSLGTHHHDLISSDELFDHLPAAVRALEEPKINGVQGFILAQQTRPHVKVALSGLGGDELFLGYSRNEIHHRFARVARWMKRMPIAGRVFENAALAGFRTFGGLRHQHSLRGLLYLARLGEASVADHLLRNAFDSHLRAIGSPFSREFSAEQSHRPSLGERFAKDFARYAEGQDANALLVGAVQHELVSKLPNDYLLNEDRVSMAHGLEVRVPFLDKMLFRAARGLPLAAHFERDRSTKGLGTQMVSVRGKAAMRRIAKRWLPDWVLERPKWGFQVSSVHHWEASIKPRFQRDVEPEWLESIGLFDQAWINNVLARPTDPRLSWHYYHIWMILGLRYWWQAFQPS